jgi:inosine/xanthosine triphosphate pyrophosphatase family protein
MNYLQTNNQGYVEDTKQILDKQIANSSIISVVNEKDRNNYFHELDRSIENARKKIEASLI